MPQKYDFSGTTPVRVITDRVLDGWNGGAALQPFLAVDNTLPRYADPDTGASVFNPNSGNVYVAYATDDLVGANPNPIKLMVSSDGGLTFGARMTVNDEQGPDGRFRQPTAPGVFPAAVSGNTGAQRNVLPRVVVSQGTPDGRVAPGQVTIIWDDFGSGPAYPNLYPPDPNTGNAPDLIRADTITGSSASPTGRRA